MVHGAVVSVDRRQCPPFEVGTIKAMWLCDADISVFARVGLLRTGVR